MMLRRSKPSTKKRHSMFLDMKPRLSNTRDGEEEVSKYMYQTKNKSLDNIGEYVPEVTPRPKIHHKSRLKRSSVMLDNALVRDYNLAVNHFEKKESNRKSVVIPSPDSNNSLSSQNSKVSSLFSSSSTLSIRDYLCEEIETETETESASPVKNCKRLFNVGGQLDCNDSYDDDDIYDLPLQTAYCRTSLEFD
ncbi:hypothetical protein ZYGR_0AD02790 [Zygosaccharomyces rouxii]|uniref:ZYRO0G12452p n=2 Tax=Zygosaccharomyces rouxii TaxID=4956 RepID=C5E0G2_ZYGRC|nr:uncharacterized protein ZYRO0G12452g [Zygosaccharomyces rouxii]KAH9202589.1 hypothetical protein LQ764DRAFT_26760 [Zygosaccharomyces rouxii]GAV51096.1 hypothetical protein ZYGR_0AD02790 [Zygosaccharomyces rouxii]CAR29596.1 ZYRO0G12452p [Zygosaccharomyces rouxii]